MNGRANSSTGSTPGQKAGVVTSGLGTGRRSTLTHGFTRQSRRTPLAIRTTASLPIQPSPIARGGRTPTPKFLLSLARARASGVLITRHCRHVDPLHCSARAFGGSLSERLGFPVLSKAIHNTTPLSVDLIHTHIPSTNSLRCHAELGVVRRRY